MQQKYSMKKALTSYSLMWHLEMACLCVYVCECVCRVLKHVSEKKAYA